MSKATAGRRNCRACQQPLIFVADARGAIHPLDARAPTFRIEKDLTGAEIAVRAEALVSHWATCPKRDELKAQKQARPR